jgi:hypothetical protein
VTPTIKGRRVRCSCGALMKPEQGARVEKGTWSWWTWWRCAVNPEHITCALPVPTL